MTLPTQRMNERRVRALCGPELAVGMALAGVRAEIATDDWQAARLVRDFLRAADAGVLLVEDRLYAALPAELQRDIDQRVVPIVVPLPGAGLGESGRGEAYLVELLRRAIGYRVRAQ